MANEAYAPNMLDSAIAADHETQTAAVAVRTTIRHLVIKGFTPAEAAGLTAFMAGLPNAHAVKGWTAREIEHLRFARATARE